MFLAHHGRNLIVIIYTSFVLHIVSPIAFLFFFNVLVCSFFTIFDDLQPFYNDQDLQNRPLQGNIINHFVDIDYRLVAIRV